MNQYSRLVAFALVAAASHPALAADQS